MLKVLKSLLDKILNSTSPSNKNTATLENVSGSVVNIDQRQVYAKNLTLIQQTLPSEVLAQPRDFKNKIVSTHSISAISESDRSDGINIRIEEAVQLINSGQSSVAKDKLFELLGEVKSKTTIHKKELVRIYNNLGVCFNESREKGGSFDEAIKYFGLAIEHDPNFLKSKINLAATFLNRRGKDDVKKAWELSTILWNQLSEDHLAASMPVLILSIYFHKGVDEALKFYQSDEKFHKASETNADVLSQIASLYLEKADFEKALSYAEQALKLNQESFQAAAYKGLSLLSIVQNSAKTFYYQVSPTFESVKEIETTLDALYKTKEMFKEGESKYLLAEIELAITTCYLWLNKSRDERYLEIRKQLNADSLSPSHQSLLNVIDFASFLKSRDFEAAYKTFIESPNFENISSDEKERVAMMLLLEGGSEQAEELFKMLESDDKKVNDCQFWLSRSAIAIILNDKNMAIQYAEKAKAISKRTKDEKKALAHYNAVMLRFADAEADRLLSGTKEYHASFPEDDALKEIKAIDENGELTQEIKDVFSKQKEWFERIKRVFKNEFVITYILERVFKRPYVEIVSMGISNRDIELVSHFNFSEPQFLKECSELLRSSPVLIFDYAALLNLSKMGLLRNLAKLGKRCVVSKRLFSKIQSELLLVENNELRFLWDFLRKDKTIELSECVKKDLETSKLHDIFDDWLIESLILCKQNQGILVTDDLRLLQFSKSEGVSGINTLCILKEWQKTKLIDEKIYSESLGDYAERFYRFISYTGDDLFRVAMEDKGKITWRSFFLINEIFSPGAELKSFATVFIRFVALLWATGLTAEDKYNWLVLFTDTFDKVIRRKISFGVGDQEIDSIFQDFAKMWAIPIQRANIEELGFMETRINKLVLGATLIRAAGLLKGHISKRILELKAKTSNSQSSESRPPSHGGEAAN